MQGPPLREDIPPTSPPPPSPQRGGVEGDGGKGGLQRTVGVASGVDPVFQ